MARRDDETAVNAPAPGVVGPGTLLNGIYRLEEQLGEGGMGEVYRATNVNNGRQDAIKIVRRARAHEKQVNGLFEKEARVLESIQSPAVAQFKLFARDPVLDLSYFASEFVVGESLLTRLRRKPATPEELHALMRRMLTGLQAVHEAGAVHRDLSPDNIILPDGDVARAKLIDFGIAKEVGSAHTTYVGELFAGKLSYVAAEQLGLRGSEVGPWSDLYSLGLVGIAFARGEPLDMGYDFPTAEAARRRLATELQATIDAAVADADAARREPVDLSAIPAGLLPVFARLLTYDWRERAQSAADVLASLDVQPFLPPVGGAPPTARPASFPKGEKKFPRRHRRQALLISTGAAALLAVAVMAGVSSRRSPAGIPDRTQSQEHHAPPAPAPVPHNPLDVRQRRASAGQSAVNAPGRAGGRLPQQVSSAVPARACVSGRFAIYFATDSTVLDANAKAFLDKILQENLACGAARVLLDGLSAPGEQPAVDTVRELEVRDYLIFGARAGIKFELSTSTPGTPADQRSVLVEVVPQ